MGSELDRERYPGEGMNHTERSKLRRLPKRGSHDAQAIHAILDAGFVAHVGFQTVGQPFVIPTLYGRHGNQLYLHGSSASRMLTELEKSIPACITVTLVDGLVLARSAFHHSMNYRSVVAFGVAQKVKDGERKLRALRTISEHLLPGRWGDVRAPNEKELKATTILEFTIEEASAKIRTGPPLDEGADYALPVWAGVLPLVLEAKLPVPDLRVAEDLALPGYVLRFRKN